MLFIHTNSASTLALAATVAFFLVTTVNQRNGRESMYTPLFHLGRSQTTCNENIPPTADALLQHTMQSEQPIRLMFGLQVKMHNLYQNPGAGLEMNATRNGCLFG